VLLARGAQRGLKGGASGEYGSEDADLTMNLLEQGV